MTHGPAGKKTVLYLATTALVVAGTLIGLGISEVGYRIYLSRVIAPNHFVRKVPGSLPVYHRPPWIYDQRFGYTYPKAEKIPLTIVSGGRVVDCDESAFFFNQQGNVGRVVGSYDNADLKILVFGDSFAATSHDGITWPLLLQHRLTERSTRNVHVVNFGRDGYGVIQMFDLAAAKIPEWKPDLAIIAFITNDLQRVRFWRSVTKVNGRWRYLVSPEPTPNPDPLTSYDTGLYHPDATPEWCRSMKGTDRRDRVLADIEHIYQEGVSVGERRAANVLTLRHSYLLASLMDGGPFHGVPDMFDFPQIQYYSYAEDPRFTESLRAIQATGVPLVLVHLAFYPEFKTGKEYVLNFLEAKLLKSLGELTGRRILETTKHIKLPVERPERLIQAPDNYHPSLAGLELYADAVAEMLVRNGLVK